VRRSYEAPIGDASLLVRGKLSVVQLSRSELRSPLVVKLGSSFLTSKVTPPVVGSMLMMGLELGVGVDGASTVEVFFHA